MNDGKNGLGHGLAHPSHLVGESSKENTVSCSLGSRTSNGALVKGRQMNTQNIHNRRSSRNADGRVFPSQPRMISPPPSLGFVRPRMNVHGQNVLVPQNPYLPCPPNRMSMMRPNFHNNQNGHRFLVSIFCQFVSYKTRCSLFFYFVTGILFHLVPVEVCQ